MEKGVIKIDKDAIERVANISYKFVDSAWFMATSLSNLIDNLTEGIPKIKYTDYDSWIWKFQG